MELTVLWGKQTNKQLKYKGKCWKDVKVLATGGLGQGLIFQHQTTAVQRPGGERHWECRGLVVLGNLRRVGLSPKGGGSHGRILNREWHEQIFCRLVWEVIHIPM